MTWLTEVRNRFNAARDRRQAMVRRQQRPPIGRIFAIARQQTGRLALRKAARLEPDPWKRGHITRRINQEGWL